MSITLFRPNEEGRNPLIKFWHSPMKIMKTHYSPTNKIFCLCSIFLFFFFCFFVCLCLHLLWQWPVPASSMLDRPDPPTLNGKATNFFFFFFQSFFLYSKFVLFGFVVVLLDTQIKLNYQVARHHKYKNKEKFCE